LKTSSRWKGGIIKEIDIFIRTENNTILYNYGVDTFETIGESKLYVENIDSEDIYFKQLVDNRRYSSGKGEYYSLTANGYLYKNIKNFIPNKDIGFKLLRFLGMEQYINYFDPPYKWNEMPYKNPYIIIYDWKSYIENQEYRRVRWYWYEFVPSEKMLKDLTTEELRILRNTLFALRGYVFNDAFLNDYFNRQYWYFPNPNVSQKDIVLSDAEQKILKYITEEENKRNRNINK